MELWSCLPNPYREEESLHRSGLRLAVWLVLQKGFGFFNQRNEHYWARDRINLTQGSKSVFASRLANLLRRVLNWLWKVTITWRRNVTWGEQVCLRDKLDKGGSRTWGPSQMPVHKSRGNKQDKLVAELWLHWDYGGVVRQLFWSCCNGWIEAFQKIQWGKWGSEIVIYVKA